MQFLTKLKTILQSNIFYLFLIIFMIIYLIFANTIIKYQSKLDNPTTITGMVIQVSYKEYGIKFTLKSSELVECTYYTDKKLDLLGKKVTVKGEVTDTYNNTIPNTFNYKKYLYQHKIYLTYKVNDLKVTSSENIFYYLKNKIIAKIRTYDKRISPYLQLFLLGNNDYLNEDIYNTYKTNGIWHLFAISGMHISLIIYLFNLIFKKWRGKKIVITGFLLYFLFLTNYTASLLRVTSFYILKNIFAYFDIHLSSEKILTLCATILLFFQPRLIFDVAFQYTFIISLALILMREKITGNYFGKIFKISLISSIVSLPITVNLNYEINLLSLFLNIIYVPFISIVIFPFTIITFLIPIMSPIYKILIIILEVSNTFFNHLNLNIIIPKMTFIIIIIYYLLLILGFKYHRWWCYLSLILIIIVNNLIYQLDNNYHIYFLDVNQGDSSILISPHQREVIMIDTGGSINSNYHISNNTIMFLKSLGIKKIDLLIISHGDADHAKETLNLLDKYQIKNIILNKGSYNNLEQEIIKKGHIINNYHSKNFNFININKYYSDDENASSIITYFNILNHKFLYLGDTTKEIEKQLLEDYNIQADVVKLAHHGSKTSSDYQFLKKIKPKLAIISSGRGNIYHHPSEEVLETLDNLHIKYLNTQTSGTIEIIINRFHYTRKEYKP